MSDETEVEVIEEEVIESENGAAADSVGEDVKALASAVAAKATEEAFIEVPVTGEDEGGKEDEKTEDQVTEIDDDMQNMGAKQASLDDFRDIPIEADDTPKSQTEEEEVVEASVTEDIEPEPAAAKEEPPAEEAAKESTPPREESSPTGTRKKVTIEESPPASPVKKDSGSPTQKEPSWWKKSKQPEEEAVEAESVEEQKSKSEDQPPPPAPEPEPEPAPEPEPEPAPKEEPAPEPEPEPTPAEPEKPAQEEFIEVPVVADEPAAEPPSEPAPEPEPEPEPEAAEKPARDEFIEVPVVADEPAPEERSQVTIEPAEEAKPEPTREAASPPPERLSRRDRAEQEERQPRAPVDTSYTTPTPVSRTPTYVTYSSWAPASDYRTTYIPTYSSYIRPSSYYQGSSSYTRPTSQYVRTFDNYVRTGPFGQSSYAVDRLRTRSRSRERSLFSYSGYYTPQPLRRNREYSLPSRYAQASGPPSSAPSRSGSFVNFMDYIVTTDRNLRRSASRSSSISRDEYGPLSRSSSLSRTILPTPADTISHWYTKQISHMDSYVKRLNNVYDNNVYGYYSTYNTSRPFTGYLTAGLGDRSTYSRSWRGHSSDLERRLATSKTYLRAYDLTRLPRSAAHQTTMKRSIFW